jgi:hypothetical protein
MNYKQVDALLQWSATFFILAGHMLTSAGPSTWPYNVFAFFVGTILFLCWAIRVKILAQIVVNAASIAITGAGVVAGVLSFFK